MSETQNKLASDIFGFDKETIEQSKNIYPTFDLSGKRLDIGTQIILEFVSEPVEKETKDKFANKKGAKKNAYVAVVNIDTVFRPQSDGTMLEVPINKKYSLWLSSRSLALGLSAALGDRTSWIGFRCKITVDTATYEQGENTAYRVEAVQ